MKNVKIIGYRHDSGGGKPGSFDAPEYFRKTRFFEEIAEKTGTKFAWMDNDIEGYRHSPTHRDRVSEAVIACEKLANVVEQEISNGNLTLAVGGDHTIAAGNQSGAKRSLGSDKSYGIIWFDAHLDSHTLSTSPSKNPHGMPLAALLTGSAQYSAKPSESDPFSSFVKLCEPGAHIDPANVFVICVRSYEPEERSFLESMGVNIVYMGEVKKHGLSSVVRGAAEKLEKSTDGFGIEVDVDAIDPLEAPGTGVPEPDGVSSSELAEALRGFAAAHPKLMTVSLAEFHPLLDENDKTRNAVKKVLTSLFSKTL